MNLSPRQCTHLEAASLFCVALFLFTVGLAPQEIIGFEARFYLFALEMWRHGASFFPTTYGMYYPDYPATSTLIIYGLAQLVGGLNKWVAVLPTAMAAAGTLVVTYFIGLLHSRQLAWCAVLLLLMTNTFVMEARTLSPDQYIGLVTALSFYLIYSARLTGMHTRLGWLPLLFAVGFAFRGPIGLIVPAGVVCVFYLLEKNPRRLIGMGLVALLTLCVCSAALFAIAWHVGGMPFVHDVLRMQVLGRMQDASLPWYFYFSESLGAYALSFPLAICAAFLVLRSDRVTRQYLLALIGWALVIIIGMSIPAGKKIRYILPFAPALALLAAFIFSDESRQWYLRALRQILSLTFLFLPVLCYVGMCVLYYQARRHGFVLDISYFNIKLAYILLAACAYLVRKHETLVMAVAALSVLTAYIFVVEPINLTINQTRGFVEQVETLRHKRQASLVFYHMNPDALPIKYVADMRVDDKPVFIATPAALVSYQARGIFIATPEYFAELPAGYHEMFAGRIGHEKVIVFERAQ